MLQNERPLAAVQLEMRRKPRRPLDESVIEQRNPRFERARHAGAIDLGQNVAGEIGLEIGVLHLRQRVLAATLPHMRAQHLDAIVALQFARETRTEQPPAQLGAANRDG